MGHGKELVPITRAVLKQFYSNWPLEPVPQSETDVIMANLDALIHLVSKPGSKVVETMSLETPKRIDDCFWRTRLHAEEGAFYLKQVASTHTAGSSVRVALEECVQKLLDAERAVNGVQQSNTEAAAAQIRKFLPKDFRMALVESRRAATESRNTKAVEDLIKKGGTIRARYDLYLKQQWERRESLVQMGNLSGMFKLLIKYIGGVPQVLLDFAKEINAKLGPMEEQRIKYGPELYLLCDLGNKVAIACAVWAENKDCAGASEQALAAVKPAVEFYCHHLERVVKFLGVLFTKSPFFITADDAEAAAHSGEPGAEETAKSGAALDRLSLSSGEQAFANGEGPQPHCADVLLAVVGIHATSSTGAGGSHRNSFHRTSMDKADGERHSRGSTRSIIPSFLRLSSNPGSAAPHPHGHSPPVSVTLQSSHSHSKPAGLPVAAAKAVSASQVRIEQPPNHQPPTAAVHSAQLPVLPVTGQLHSVELLKSPSGRVLQTLPSGAAVNGGPLSTSLSMVSGDFMSCCDNMSWVSSTHYQGTIVDDDSIQDLHGAHAAAGVVGSYASAVVSGVGTYATAVSGYAGLGPGVHHRTGSGSGAGPSGSSASQPPALPTIFSEGGLADMVPSDDLRPPRHAPASGVVMEEEEEAGLTQQQQQPHPAATATTTQQQQQQNYQGGVTQAAAGAVTAAAMAIQGSISFGEPSSSSNNPPVQGSSFLAGSSNVQGSSVASQPSGGGAASAAGAAASAGSAVSSSGSQASSLLSGGYPPSRTADSAADQSGKAPSGSGRRGELVAVDSGRLATGSMVGLATDDVGSTWSRDDGSAHVGLQGGISDMATAGGSVRPDLTNADNASIGLTSVLEEGAGGGGDRGTSAGGAGRANSSVSGMTGTGGGASGRRGGSGGGAWCGCFGGGGNSSRG